MVVNRPARANIFGCEFDLKPLNPSVFEPKNILVADNGSASELLKRHPSVLLEASFDTSALLDFPSKPEAISQVKPGSTVLILRAGGIGDHVMLLPALAAFKHALPSGVSVWLSTQKEKHPIFNSNQAVDKLLPLPLSFDNLLKADFVIDFSGSIDDEDFNSLNMTDYYMKVLGLDKKLSFDKRPSIHTNPKSAVKIRYAVNNLKGNAFSRPLVILQWKSSNSLRDLIPEKLLCLTDVFQEVQFITPISLKKDKFEGNFTQIYKNKIIDISDCIESLEDYIALFEFCDGVVSTDTAAYHLAQAFKKPSLALFGPISSDLRLRYYHKAYAIDADYIGQTCHSPCGLHKVKDRCPEAETLNTAYAPCFLSIDQETLFAAFEEMCCDF
jgi:ADP-heptose:LPS heptosyltransferase